jgi:hypothetical protein
MGIIMYHFKNKNIVVIDIDINQGNLSDAFAFIYVVQKKTDINIYFIIPSHQTNQLKIFVANNDKYQNILDFLLVSFSTNQTFGYFNMNINETNIKDIIMIFSKFSLKDIIKYVFINIPANITQVNHKKYFRIIFLLNKKSLIIIRFGNIAEKRSVDIAILGGNHKDIKKGIDMTHQVQVIEPINHEINHIHIVANICIRVSIFLFKNMKFYISHRQAIQSFSNSSIFCAFVTHIISSQYFLINSR